MSTGLILPSERKVNYTKAQRDELLGYLLVQMRAAETGNKPVVLAMCCAIASFAAEHGEEVTLAITQGLDTELDIKEMMSSIAAHRRTP